MKKLGLAFVNALALWPTAMVAALSLQTDTPRAYNVMAPPTVVHWNLPPLRTGGGNLKVKPEDFQVLEIPQVKPSGRGDFLYLLVEKRGVTTDAMQAAIAKSLRLSRASVKVAGRKDKDAVTQQWVSVPAMRRGTMTPISAERLQDPSYQAALNRIVSVGDDSCGNEEARAVIKVVEVARHHRPLALGDLRGNRFRIRLRGVPPATMEALPSRFEVLTSSGFANTFGPQRFSAGKSIRLGLSVLEERRRSRLQEGGIERAVNQKMSPNERLGVSALQSSIFNCWLQDRARDGLMQTVIPGDILAPISRRHSAASFREAFGIKRNGEGGRKETTRRAVEEGNKHEFITAFHDCVSSSSSSSSSSSVHDELNRLQEAVSNCELGVTGPLFGDKKDVIAAEDALGREWQLLDMLGLLYNEEETEEGDGRRVLHGRSVFDVEGLLSSGTLGGRRQAIAFPSDAHIDVDGASSTSSSSVYLRFSLPPGAYATSFLGSLCGPFGGSAWAALQARNRKRNKRRRRGS